MRRLEGRWRFLVSGPFLSRMPGSVEIYFGPKAPKGIEPNWIKTIRGEEWFVALRLYGQLESILNQEWEPNDIERTK